MAGVEFQGKVYCSKDVVCFSGYFSHEILILANIFALVSHEPELSSTLFSFQYSLDFFI
jgi:hypothetical protein